MPQKITKFFAPTVKRRLSTDYEESQLAKRLKMYTELEIPEGDTEELNMNPRVLVKDIKNHAQNSKDEEGSRLSQPGDEKVQNFIKKLSNEQEKACFQCKVCLERYCTRTAIYKHMKRVHQEMFKNSLISCTVCDSKCFTEGHLTVHMKAKHPHGEVKRYECDFCGISKTSKLAIDTHLKTHLSKVKCHICGIELKPNSVQLHLKSFHATEKEFKCEICSETFKQKRYLTTHSKIHNKEFHCEICNRRFPYLYYLKRHKKENHENPRKFECEKCDKKFNRKGDLNKHQKVHDLFNPKRFKCQKCSYSTNLKKSHDRHQKVHERREEKYAAMKNPVKCEKCEKFFKNKYIAYNHAQQAHPLQLLQCDLCGMYLKGMKTLKRHITIMHLSKFQK